MSFSEHLFQFLQLFRRKGGSVSFAFNAACKITCFVFSRRNDGQTRIWKLNNSLRLLSNSINHACIKEKEILWLLRGDQIRSGWSIIKYGNWDFFGFYHPYCICSPHNTPKMVSYSWNHYCTISKRLMIIHLITFGVCPLTFPARAREPWTLPDNKTQLFRFQFSFHSYL